MDIKITEQLRALRKARGNTQEELASHLGITVQAVSKWERGDGYPDITLLPYIALFYETTVDELLGVSEIEKQKKIEEYMGICIKNSNLGRIEANIELMREALREFPNDLNIMQQLMHNLFFVDKDEYLDECIALGEKILQKSVSDNQRYSVLHTLVYSYNKKSMIDKAKEYAEKLPDAYCTKNNVLEAVLRGDELGKLTQQNIGIAIASIDHSVKWMLRSREYLPAERVFALETIVKLYDLFFYDGDYGHQHSALHMLWSDIARNYAQMQNADKTIKALSKAYEHAKVMDNFPTGKYTSMFVDTAEYTKSDFSRNFEYSYIDIINNTMKDKAFDFIRETDEFKKIKA